MFSDKIDFMGLMGGRKGENGMDSMSLSGASGVGELSDEDKCDLSGLNDGEGAQDTYGVAAPGSSVDNREGKCSVVAVVDKDAVLPLVLLVLLVVRSVDLLFATFRVSIVGFIVNGVVFVVCSAKLAAVIEPAVFVASSTEPIADIAAVLSGSTVGCGDDF